MITTEILVKTWVCSHCPHKWQFSGGAVDVSPYDLSDEQVQQQFPEIRCTGLKSGRCPICYAQGVEGVLGLSIDTDEMARVSVSTDEDLEQRQIEELDELGQPVMVQTGERYELRINQSNGQISTVAVPVFEQKMRELTEQELADLKTQRDRNLDELEKVAA